MRCCLYGWSWVMDFSHTGLRSGQRDPRRLHPSCMRWAFLRPNSWRGPAILIEIFGGAAILLGAFVALVSVPAIVLLAVAVFTVHLPYGFSSIKLVSFISGRAQFGPPGYECDLLYIVAILMLALSPPSPWSIDAYRLRGDDVLD